MPDGSAPNPAPSRPPRRWRRWLLAAAAGILAGIVILAAILWIWRAEALNRILARVLDRWEVTIESLTSLPGGGIEVRGIIVRHPRASEPVVEVDRAVSTAPWRDLLSGRLHSLILENPVIRWRNDLVDKSDDEAREATPFLSWDRIAIRSGRLILRLQPEPAPPLLDSVLNWEGGAATVFSDGTLHTEPQKVSLDQPSVNLQEGIGALTSAEFAATAVRFTAEVDRESGHLAVTDVAVDSPVFRVSGNSGSGADKSGMSPASGDTGPIRSVGVDRAKVTALDARVRWPLAAGASPLEATMAGDLVLDSLTWVQGGSIALAGGATVTLTAGDSLRTGRIDGKATLTPEGAEISSLSIDEAVWTDLSTVLASLGVPAEALTSLPATSGTLSARLADLSINAKGVHSRSPQSVALAGFTANLPGTGSISSPAIQLEAVPDEIVSSRRFRAITIERPEIGISATTPDHPEAGGQAAAPSGEPAWHGWTTEVLTVTPGRLDVALPALDGSRLTASIEAATDSGSGTPRYRITLSSIALTHPDVPDAPLATAKALEVTANAASLWEKHELESLRLTGLRAEIGEALMSITGDSEEDSAPEESASAPGPAAAPAPWKIASTVVDDTAIEMESPGDGRRLSIPVKRLEFRNLPLDAAALAALDDVYQIEIPAFTIYSPWTEGQKVVELDSNYIRFTPSGLLRKRLERVDIMLPSLYAGQPLFDYVDACRTRFAEMADTGRPALLAATGETGTALRAAADTATASGWHIPLYTGSGRVIVAPRGHPWPWIPVIPFRNARDSQGRPVPFLLEGSEVHGELAIDPGWYHFPEYKVSLRISDRGRIVFNSPSRTTDNNLVEVFEGNTLIYRQITIENLWLAVTYDDTGIYARFGGETCEGDLTGGLNVYLDDLYTWDAWVSLTGANLQPLTDKLTPEYLSVEGKLNELTVKANGDAVSLYQAFADLKMDDPGNLRIQALDSLKEKMRELEPLARDLAEIGVESLRDFAYTSCMGTVRLFGQEGTMEFRLAGDGGSRNFRIRLHDYRGRLPKAFIPF